MWLRALTVGAVAYFWCLSSPAAAQQDKLHVAVTSPPGLPVQVATFYLDGERQRITFDPMGKANVVFTPTGRRLVDLQFIVEQADNVLRGRKWSTKVDLNRSGYLEYQILADGTGRVSQWPLVTWLSAAGRLDIALNASTIGSTRVEKGVAPNRRHKAEWRSGGRAVCTYEFLLDYNVSRAFKCDAATGKVTEE